MQLNKLGQGLAVSAVSALVITGLSVSAPAASAADGPDVRLLSQHDGIASVRRDADDPDDAGGPSGVSVTLTAERLDPDVLISFEVNPDPEAADDATTWVEIAPPAAGASYATVEWTPASAQVGTSVALRAVATTAGTGGAPATRTFSTRRNVAVGGPASPHHAVAVQSVRPFFAQPYTDSSRTAVFLPVSGTTSATTGTVELSAWNSADGSFQGQTDASVRRTEFKSDSFPPIIDGGEFTGVLDIAGFDVEGGDTLAVRAERDSDSVVPFQLEEQEIASIQTSAATLADAETTRVTVRVRDQLNRAVVGAEVRRSSDGGLVGYTDGEGAVATTQPNSTTATYYANTTDVDAYEAGTDVVSGQVATPAYVPAVAGTAAVLADGTVFDDREHAAGDIALQVVDHQGKPFASEEDVTYSLSRSGQDPTAPTTATTDADGRIVVPFDPAGPDGKYVLAFTAPASVGGTDEKPATFIAGDAVLGLTPTGGTAPSGGEITYAGSLTVAGEPLVGRTVDLAYTRGTEQAPGTEADAALALGAERALAGQLTTGKDGTFSVTVDDLAEVGGPAETGGRLTVTARGLGDTGEATADFAAVPVAPQPPVTTTDVDEDARTVLRLTGSKMGNLIDRLRVTGPSSVAGAMIKVYAQDDDGRWRPVKSRKLNRRGDARLTLRDHNGGRFTRYVVRLLPGDGVEGSRSTVRKIQ